MTGDPSPHIEKEQELSDLKTDKTSSVEIQCSILCCYHDKDVRALGAITIEEIHKSHLKNYVVKKQE